MAEPQSFSFTGPLYEQVSRMLRSRILAGEWEPRAPLPGEAELSRELGVSVGTVRKAMDQLTRDNIVIRERGRGTFVRAEAERQSTAAFLLCDRDGRAMAPEIRLVGAEVVLAAAGEAKALRLRGPAFATSRILRLRREWRAGAAIVCRETILVEAARFPDLASRIVPAAETLFATYAEPYRLKVERIQWAIGSPPLRDEAPTEGDPGRPGSELIIRRTALDARATPIEVCEQRVLLDHCCVQITR